MKHGIKLMRVLCALICAAALMSLMTACANGNTATAQTKTPDNEQAAVESPEAERGGTAAATDASASGEASGGRGGRSSGEMGGGFAMTDKSADDVLQAMIAETVDKFRQLEYEDAETELTLPYNLYLPEDYDETKTYPMVVFIADMSVSGQDVTAPLTQGYGGIIWATEEEQAKHECIVLVPEFPVTILDDHSGHTTTEYVEMTVRLIENVSENYAVDTNRIYVTGQSMGCMTFLLLASEHPDLFAAEIFVSGQWEVSALDGIASQTCFYITAQGDPGGSGGQLQLYNYLTAQGVEINGIDEWDAQWSQEEFDEAVQALLDSGDSTLNFATFTVGSTLPEGATEGASEHMTSFDFAYKIDAVREWLFEQSK